MRILVPLPACLALGTSATDAGFDGGPAGMSYGFGDLHTKSVPL